MIVIIPVEIDENTILFVHQPYIYTVKTRIQISATENVTIGFNPCNTLYPEEYGRSNWYVEKALNRCNTITEHE